MLLRAGGVFFLKEKLGKTEKKGEFEGEFREFEEQAKGERFFRESLQELLRRSSRFTYHHFPSSGMISTCFTLPTLNCFPQLLVMYGSS